MRNRKIFLVIAALLVLAAGAWTVNFVLGEPETASAPIRSVPLELEPTAAAVLPTEMALPGSTAVPTQQSAPPLAEPTETPATRPVIFEIRQDETEVRFTLNEVLRGEPKTVVGTSNQVAGQMAVDLADLSTAQIGLIQVNARTLATDNNFRNRAIRNVILETDDFEFITFAPTAISGLPDTAVPGAPLTFQIAGDLTIRDVTQAVTFDVTAAAVSETRLAGTAVATVQRADYNLVIPEVEGVADVDEAVRLEIDFVATAVP